MQHYTELIEEAVRNEWNLPEGWKLIGQMPFGKPTSTPGEKQFNFQQEHLRVFK